MKKRILGASLAVTLVASLVVATTVNAGRTPSKTDQNTAVSGTISMLAVWTGAEGKSIQAVLKGFKQKFPHVKVNYKAAADPGQALSTSVQGGNPPDVAALPSPGLMKDFANRGALKPINFAKGV